MDREVLDTQWVWERFSGPLSRFILSRIDNKHDAEDVLQNVFYKVHGGIGTLRNAERLAPWIYRITRNAIIDYYRRRERDVPLTSDVGEPVTSEDGSDEAFLDIVECLQPMVERLPERYREAIMLVEYGGMAQKDLGGRLGLSASGARSRIQRARAQLKDMLLDCCHLQFDRFGHVINYEPVDGSCRFCAAG